MKTFRYCLKATLPVCAGYITLGMGFGLLMYDKGYSWLWSLLMSLFIYAGSLQFVGVTLLTGGVSPISAAVTSLLVNLRHVFYGISMLEKYRDTGLAKPYLIFSLTDETYSLVCSAQPPAEIPVRKFYLYVSLLNHLWWVLGSVLGGLLGHILPFDTTGIDFAMTALFVTVALEQWEQNRDHFPALLGFGVAIVCRILFGASSFLLPAMAGISAGLMIKINFSH